MSLSPPRLRTGVMLSTLRRSGDSGRMTNEAQEPQRIISASVRDMLDACRIQASAGPVTDKALEEILFRASHGVLQSLAPYPRAQRVALLPSVVRPLAAFFEEMAGADGSPTEESEEL
jgi:hypothetical protein